MVHKNNRPTVHDMRAMKARGQKISMLYVTTPDEAAAADAAGIHMLSIEAKYFTPDMRAAAGRCFVQVGLPFGPYGSNVTAEDYLRAAFHFTAMGGDSFYCRHESQYRHLDRLARRRQDRDRGAKGLGPCEAA
jgi:3-methyl-2-oxobutanoate hydroxymethyltransferase